nr:phosphoesterase [Pelomonas sp. KK5]
MKKHPQLAAVSAAVALLAAWMPAQAAVSVKGIVAGTLFTAPVIADSPAQATSGQTAASVYAGATVCFDANNNGVCDAGEVSAITKADGSFLISSRVAAPLIADISTAATNNGKPVTQHLVLRVAADQIAAATKSPLLPAAVAVTPLSTEVVRMMEANGTNYAAESTALAGRLGLSVAEALADPATLAGSAQTAVMQESVALTNRWAYASKLVDRGDAASVPAAEQVAMNVEGIPRYDHIFVVMLENKATLSIKGSAYAPNINKYLSEGNQFTSYFATGNPSEPNYTALGGADDWGITDDNQWNCGATGANAVQDLPTPDKTQPGLANSPFTATCAQATNHNITGRANIFNALSKAGLQWRTYSESMNPGQDFRTDSIADSAVTAMDYVYAPGTAGNNSAAIGNPNLQLPLPAGLYKTKHHPGMAYQNVRSEPGFKANNRTLGGGQWDGAMLAGSKYAIPAGYDLDQFGTDLLSGDVGQLNFVVPDQCDDMHGISVPGTDKSTGKAGTASDCSSVSNAVSPTAVSPIITRGDNYVKVLVDKIQASPLWRNPNKRVAIVIMFDEGNATSGFNSCCGWNPVSTNVDAPLVNGGGATSRDATIAGYGSGNKGHGESIFGLLTNQASAPKGLVDSDYYSHFSFVRTLQDMFGLADPADPFSYMNRSKYTQAFIASNLALLPEYAGSADAHFDSVRPMNHSYVFPTTYTQRQSGDVNTAAQTGPDATQVNLWSLK